MYSFTYKKVPLRDVVELTPEDVASQNGGTQAITYDASYDMARCLSFALHVCSADFVIIGSFLLSNFHTYTQSHPGCHKRESLKRGRYCAAPVVLCVRRLSGRV